MVHSPAFSTPAHVDVTVVSALSAEALAKGSAHCAGVACNLAVQDKRASYPLVPVITFAIEDHGRIGMRLWASCVKLLRPKGICVNVPCSAFTSGMGPLASALRQMP